MKYKLTDVQNELNHLSFCEGYKQARISGLRFDYTSSKSDEYGKNLLLGFWFDACFELLEIQEAREFQRLEFKRILEEL